jgi:hypothetical protein
MRGLCKVVVEKRSVEKRQLSEVERVHLKTSSYSCQKMGRVLEMVAEGD